MTDIEPGWKTYDDFALGIGTNRLPAEDLTGTILRVRTESGLDLRCDFDDAHEVTWNATGAPGWEGASGVDPYDAVAVGEDALFLDLPFRSRPREALTVISSRRTRRASWSPRPSRPSPSRASRRSVSTSGPAWWATESLSATVRRRHPRGT